MMDLTQVPVESSGVSAPPPGAGGGAGQVAAQGQLIELPLSRVRLTPVPYTTRRTSAQSGAAVEEDGSRRHARQAGYGHRLGGAPHLLAELGIAPLETTREFPLLAQAPIFPLDTRYRRFTMTVEPGPDPAAPSDFVYLFNVIVALEWLPTRATLLPIMRGLRAASDLLYDATNGCMAFGQVVFAGPELMNQADIQVMASNRFHPRSMVNGLNEERKYAPIRIGRGSWHKNNRVVLPWDESVAFRAITHEWAHYALSLRDEYIDDLCRVTRRGDRLYANDQGRQTLVVPKVHLPLESLMATLDASELVPMQRRKGLSAEIQSRLLNAVETWYSGASAQILGPNDGPQRFPISMPQFYTVEGSQINDQAAQELTIGVDDLDLDHGWLYTLDLGADHTARLIAQGSVDGRAQSFEIASDAPLIPGNGATLLGARRDSTILAIGSEKGGPAARVATIGADGEQVPWADQTPSAIPVVAVLPDLGATGWDDPLMVRLHLAGAWPSLAWIIEPGGTPAAPYAVSEAGAREAAAAPGGLVPITQLDGSVLLGWRDGESTRYWVAEYSHGGNPPTSVRSAGAPISAGSAEGNLMIFSRTTDSGRGDADYDLRIVTTRNYTGFTEGRPGEPRSYLFSVASNLPVDYAHYQPTIVLYYDVEALDDDKDLLIYRYDADIQEWQPVPTYLPGGAFYAAAALDATSAPHLIAQYPPGEVRVEYYQLFAIDRPGRRI